MHRQHRRVREHRVSCSIGGLLPARARLLGIKSRFPSVTTCCHVCARARHRRSILELCSSIFKAPASLCALFDEQRVFITEQDGNVIPRGNFPWRWTLCGWSLAFKNPQVLVIPDTHLDARFANNIKITEPPHVRFYCGAPLVASNGHRLGTLCFADVKPREFDAASCILMNNLSELVVRQLEKNIALKARVQENEELSVAYGGLRRTLDAFDACVALVDMSAKADGEVVYANAALLKWMGRERGEVTGQQLSSLFEAKGGTPVMDAAAQQAIAANKPHTVTSASVAHGSSVDGSDVQLQLRPAASGMLDDNAMPVGIPAFLSQGSTLVDGKQFYFVLVEGKQASRRSKRSATSHSSRSSGAHATTGCKGLDLQHLLGKGSFGSVYYGTWFDTPVAIKVMEMEDSDNRASLEAMLGQQLKHPNVLTTHHHFTKPLSGSAEPSVGYSARGPLSRTSPSMSIEDSCGSKAGESGSGNALGGPPAASGAVDCGWAVIDFGAESKRKGVVGPGLIDTASDGWLSGANAVTTKRWPAGGAGPRLAVRRSNQRAGGSEPARGAGHRHRGRGRDEVPARLQRGAWRPVGLEHHVVLGRAGRRRGRPRLQRQGGRLWAVAHAQHGHGGADQDVRHADAPAAGDAHQWRRVQGHRRVQLWRAAVADVHVQPAVERPLARADHQQGGARQGKAQVARWRARAVPRAGPGMHGGERRRPAGVLDHSAAHQRDAGRGGRNRRRAVSAPNGLGVGAGVAQRAATCRLGAAPLPPQRGTTLRTTTLRT
eukprot:358413-Chlamydomonas_euryale.AAC.16